MVSAPIPDDATGPDSDPLGGTTVEEPTRVEHPRSTRRGSSSSTRLVIVSNRLPVQRVEEGGSATWKLSPGGLVTAMTPLLEERGGSWLGWPGGAGEEYPSFRHGAFEVHPVSLSQEELEGHYLGFSNCTLWPLYHDSILIPEFRRRWWGPHREVNRRFAAAAAETASEGDLVWIHDYQLQLVPRMLRELRPDLRIGFFLHIPFPAEELFARLPWRREILEGLLGADTIGFQTRLGAMNFKRAAQRFAGAKPSRGHLSFNGRHVRVDAFPISIDTGRFESLARDEQVKRASAELRGQLGASRLMVLGVDRLDYTKGIDIRLRAIDEVLRRGEFTASDFVFVQVAVPSREAVDEYAEMRSRIEELVGRINGQFGEPGRVVVHYLRRSLPQDQLAAYYLAADVMLVTPLRDGMNLVAKEFVACRSDDSGILVLSEFAGAARELRQAVQVNPFDIDGVASAIEGALRMDQAEARRRMRPLRRTVRRNDVYRWAADFLGALES